MRTAQLWLYAVMGLLLLLLDTPLGAEVCPFTSCDTARPPGYANAVSRRRACAFCGWPNPG